MEWLKKIQNKPEPQRKKIMYVSVSIMMLMVIVIWFLSLKRFSFKSAELEELTQDIHQQIAGSNLAPKEKFKLPLE